MDTVSIHIYTHTYIYTNFKTCFLRGITYHAVWKTSKTKLKTFRKKYISNWSYDKMRIVQWMYVCAPAHARQKVIHEYSHLPEEKQRDNWILNKIHTWILNKNNVTHGHHLPSHTATYEISAITARAPKTEHVKWCQTHLVPYLRRIQLRNTIPLDTGIGILATHEPNADNLKIHTHARILDLYRPRNSTSYRSSRTFTSSSRTNWTIPEIRMTPAN
jgi:hypothetical protein